MARIVRSATWFCVHISTQPMIVVILSLVPGTYIDNVQQEQEHHLIQQVSFINISMFSLNAIICKNNNLAIWLKKSLCVAKCSK